MKLKKFLSALIAGTMVLGTMAFPAFAEEEQNVGIFLPEPVMFERCVEEPTVIEGVTPNVDKENPVMLMSDEQLTMDSGSFINNVFYENSYVKLGTDITISSSEKYTIWTGNNTTIDLNGHSLRLDNSFLKVWTGETLTLTDTSESKNGAIISNNNSYNFYVLGTLNIQEGNIYAPLGSKGVLASQGGTVNMSGGTITGYLGVWAQLGSSFYMTGGTITTNNSETNKFDVGVVGLFGGEIVITGGSIDSNYCAVELNGYSDSYSTYGCLKATIDESAEINGTYATTVWDKAELNIKGGTIKSEGIAISGNGTDHSGTTINISGGNIVSSNHGMYIPQIGNVTITGGTITGGNVAIEIESGNLNISGGVLSSTSTTETFLNPKEGDGTTVAGAALAVVCRSKDTKDGYFGDMNIDISGGTFNGINGAAVYLYQDMSVDSSLKNLTISGGKFNNALNEEGRLGCGFISHDDCKSKVKVNGGTFSNDVKDYVINGYYAKNNGDGTYTVLPAESKIIDTAKTTGATVTLDNLEKNSAVNPAEDATYKVVVSTAPTGDVEKANAFIKTNNDTNTSKAIFDISVKKVDSYGVETDLGGDEDHSVKDQQVTLTLGETPERDTPIYVYHVKDNGDVDRVATVQADGTNKVTFTAPSFSTYAATYTAAPLVSDNITNNIGVEFAEIADTSSYNIVLKARDGKTINRFMSTDLTFAMDVKDGAVGYEITPAANINLIDNGNGRYEFNLDGRTSSGATGTEITIGTVKFDGYGKIDFEVKTAATDDTNVVNTATLTDNIVDSYTIAGNGTTTGKLDLSNKIENAVFKAPTKDLTVNVKFNNKVSNQAKAYQDMKVTISGGDLAAPITRELGSDGSDVTFASDTYTTTVADTLTQNITYTVTVSGAGYRTARYTVTMTADKTLNFWNNVKNNAEVVEVGSDISKAKNVTFLAGEIVKDNNINIYDLSAVVSYFGTDNLEAQHPEYAKYDLNRDGKIDSKDVAYVLVSWGK